jgi:hypothetical protein
MNDGFHKNDPLFVLKTAMTDVKLPINIKQAIDKVKENKTIDFSECEEKLWPDLDVGQEDGSTVKMDVYQMKWKSGITINLFADGKTQIDAMYKRATKIAIAVRKSSFEAGKIDDMIKMLIEIFADVSQPASNVLVPINGGEPVWQYSDDDDDSDFD